MSFSLRENRWMTEFLLLVIKYPGEFSYAFQSAFPAVESSAPINPVINSDRFHTPWNAKLFQRSSSDISPATPSAHPICLHRVDPVIELPDFGRKTHLLSSRVAYRFTGSQHPKGPPGDHQRSWFERSGSNQVTAVVIMLRLVSESGGV